MCQSIIEFVEGIQDTKYCHIRPVHYIGLISVKEEGWMEFSEGSQGCSEGLPEGNPELDLHYI